MRQSVLLLSLLSLWLWAQGRGSVGTPSYCTAPAFVENRGQWHPDVLYLWRTSGLNAWITREGVVYDFYVHREVELPVLEGTSHRSRKSHEEAVVQRSGHVIRLRHVGGRAMRAVGQERQPAYHNYFIGNDPTRWVSRVPLYGEVRVEEIYPGIHQRWYVERGQLRYDYIIEPGADPAQLRLMVEGAEWLQPAGNKLLIGTRFGAVEHADLFAYQIKDGKTTSIPIRWQTEQNVVRFAVGDYDRSVALFIDPIVGSSILGGSDNDVPRAIAVDRSGAIYIGGTTFSIDFPTTPGSY